MEVFFVLFPLSFGLALLALGAFVFAVRRGQYDDLDNQAARVVWDGLEEQKISEK